jgi:hypothetical protein
MDMAKITPLFEATKSGELFSNVEELLCGKEKPALNITARISSAASKKKPGNTVNNKARVTPKKHERRRKLLPPKPKDTPAINALLKSVPEACYGRR